MSGARAEPRQARLEPEDACERDLRQIERCLHQRVSDLALLEVGEPSRAIGFVLHDRR